MTTAFEAHMAQSKSRPEENTLFVNGCWGGGHTVDTDPTRKGWRCRPNKPGSNCALLGRRGIGGCASIMQLSDGRLDVALYEETPEVVHDHINRNEAHMLDPVYLSDQVILETSGWALKVIPQIEALVARAQA